MDNLNNIEHAFALMLNILPPPDDGVLVIANQRGEIVEVNAAFEYHFGYERAEVLGKPISMLMPMRYIQDHGAAFTRTRQDLSASKHIGHLPADRILAHGLCKDGKEKEIEITLGTILLSNRLYFTAVIKILGTGGVLAAVAKHESI